MAGDEGRVPPYLRRTESYDHRSVPPGWDDNPTAWPKRIGLAGLASIGFTIALYLSLFQLGLIEGVWDPFFDSPRVLEYLGWPDAIPGVRG